MDVDSVANEIARRFIQRRDVKAVQGKDGAYRPHGRYEKQDDGSWLLVEPHPWKKSDLVAHLAGEATYGHYLVDTEGRCRLFAFDIDLVNKPVPLYEADPQSLVVPRDAWHGGKPETKRALAHQLRAVATVLAGMTQKLLDVPVAIAYSGNKGLHVYAFTGGIEASDARQAAVEVLAAIGTFDPSRGSNFYAHRDAYRAIEIEVFPKQDQVGEDGLGNLMRLPLGVNRKTGQPGWFIDPSALPAYKLAKADPAAVLADGCNL